MQLHNLSLQWISSFLFGKSQRVVFNGSTSDTALFASRVIQGSVLRPTLLVIYINFQLRELSTRMPGASWAFADDLKFVLPANECGWKIGQTAVGVV